MKPATRSIILISSALFLLVCAGGLLLRSQSVQPPPSVPLVTVTAQPPPPPYCPPAPSEVIKTDAPRTEPPATPLSLDKIQIHKLDLDPVRDLLETTVIFNSELPELPELRLAVTNAIMAQGAIVNVDAPMIALSVGPVLDSPDQVSVESLTQQGQTLQVTIVYTNVRAQGVQLRRNIPWRPLVAVPLPITDAGKYKLLVRWNAVERVPDGKVLSIIKPRLDHMEFHAQHDTVQSDEIASQGLRFMVEVPARWRLPAEGKQAIPLGLYVTNAGAKGVVIRRVIPWPTLTDTRGKRVAIQAYATDHAREPDDAWIDPGKTKYWDFTAKLAAQRPGEKARLYLGEDPHDQGWASDPLEPGEYTLSLRYRDTDAREAGVKKLDVTTPALRIEVSPQKKTPAAKISDF